MKQKYVKPLHRLLLEPMEIYYLQLFFFGPYTSLIVNTGRQQLHYFIEPPSILPNWFYQNHENVATINSIKYVDIPENVQYQFYEKFIDLLHSFFSFPI